MNLIKLLGRLADLLAPVYSIETLCNLRKREIEQKLYGADDFVKLRGKDLDSKLFPKESVMNLKTVVLALFVASLFVITEAQDIPSVVFTASTENLTGPASVEEGYVNLALENQDEIMRAHGIFRVKDGADLEAAKGLMPRLFGSFTSGEEMTAEDVYALTDGFYGGAVFIGPGTQKEVGVTLTPGTYVIYADGITDDGLLMESEYITTLEVTPSTTPRVTPPTPDYTIKMVDHAFAFPADIKAGKHLFRIENLGHQDHMMFISKYLPGKGHEDGLKLLEDETLDSRTVFEEETIGVHAIWPGLFNDVVLDLEPGTYGAICFSTDPETGAPHAMLGMFQSFTVTE
jgi:hypothetical protein